jgi:hypothetical protein
MESLPQRTDAAFIARGIGRMTTGKAEAARSGIRRLAKEVWFCERGDGHSALKISRTLSEVIAI